MSILFDIAAGVVLLSALIFVHELGHFLTAKALGVKVLKFSIGFGPRLLGFTKGETEYQIAALPLGGYVKMAGEDPTEAVDPADAGRTFSEQSPWKRLAIAFAGPAMNLAFPVLIYLGLGWVQNGQPVAGPVIGSVAPGSPAAEAGLRPGDVVRSVAAPGGAPSPVRYFSDLRDLVSPHAGERLTFLVARGGTELPVAIVPASQDDSNLVEKKTRGIIGVTPVYASALAAPAAGVSGPLQPLDLVVSAGGRAVRNLGELQAVLARAGCAPLDLEVRRGAGKTRAPVALQAVPTCAPGGAAAIVPADPTLAAYVALVDEGSPAAAAGLRRGDQLASLNGHPVRSYLDLNNQARDFQVGSRVTLGLADGRSLTFELGGRAAKDEATGAAKQLPVPGFHLDDRLGIDLAGLVANEVSLQRTFSEVAQLAVLQVWEMIRLTELGLARLVTGQLSMRTVGGPISLFTIAKEAAEAGVGTYFFQMGFISVTLGLMNLLPVPVLDGGHIVFALMEGLTRRRLSLRVREAANWVGVLLLLSLMVFAIGNDIVKTWG